MLPRRTRRLREVLWRLGFMRFAAHNKLPSLLRQEKSATEQLLLMLLRMYSESLKGGEEAEERKKLAVKELIRFVLVEVCPS